MKYFTAIILMSGLLILNGCINNEGPVGPQGPQGPKGDQGPAGESSYVFEFDHINFTAPDYEVYLTYPDNFEGYNSDVALVYLLWGTEQVNNDTLDIWRPLPQTIIKPQGTLVYNDDFTKNDVRLFLRADFSLDSLTAIDTDEWIARVVVVPGNFWSSARIPKTIGYYDLLDMLQMDDIPVKGKIIERK